MCAATSAIVCAPAAPAIAAASGLSATSCRAQYPPAAANADNVLQGAAARSGRDAWAVGYVNEGAVFDTVIDHWDGKAWTRMHSPDPAGMSGHNVLTSVTATSADDAWAAGASSDTSSMRTLIAHWDGTRWRHVPSPDPGSGYDYLYGISAASPDSVWAVGVYYNGSVDQTLIEHWDGTSWSVQRSPNPGGSARGNRLYAVSATSSDNAWAVGVYDNGTALHSLIEHWDGTSWRVQRSPEPPGGANFRTLDSVSADSPADAWAVGNSRYGTLVEHWDGTGWKLVPNAKPTGATDSGFHGVTAVSSANAWAVGGYVASTPSGHGLIEHWNGARWSIWQMPTNASAVLEAVAATPRHAWAVGFYDTGARYLPLVVRCG